MEKELFLGTAINGDCLDEMGYIPDKSIDMILCDLPYGTTQNKWDSVIPFPPLWKEYERIIKYNGAIVLTASQPFSSALVMSNPSLFKYEWVWRKSRITGHLNSSWRPLFNHEVILVFSKGKPVYFPQMVKKPEGTGSNSSSGKRSAKARLSPNNYNTFLDNAPRTIPDDMFLPRSVVDIDDSNSGKIHPTQKPVALFEYLIKTYTNPGELVLDNCAGSFTTAIACINTGRRYICIEKDEAYYNLGVNRIKDHSDFLL
jgi:site-specific DNA-methyltransferase (adenine-specific)